MVTVKEVFCTVQGEGGRVGERSVFVRFAGCNLWSGRPEDRERGSGECARWCDTDFIGGESLDLVRLFDRMEGLWPRNGRPRWVVLTGGEPSLQLDEELLGGLKMRGWLVAIETNGTRHLPHDLDWTTVSPKRGTDVVVRRGSEIKIVLADGDGWTEDEILRLGDGTWRYRWVQPVDPAEPSLVGASALTGLSLYRPAYEANLRRCIEWVHRHPSWRLSLQTHKWAGVP